MIIIGDTDDFFGVKLVGTVVVGVNVLKTEKALDVEIASPAVEDGPESDEVFGVVFLGSFVAGVAEYVDVFNKFTKLDPERPFVSQIMANLPS